MKIKSLSLSNFKSFRQSGELSFGAFNVIVGPNAAGKTNLVQAVKFLKDIVNDGFENAFSLQGGKEFLFNSKIADGDSSVLKINFEFTDEIFEADFFQDLVHENNILYGALFELNYQHVLLKKYADNKHTVEITEVIDANVYLKEAKAWDESNADILLDELNESFGLRRYEYDEPYQHIIITKTPDGKIHYGLTGYDNTEVRGWSISSPFYKISKEQLLIEQERNIIDYLRSALTSVNVFDFSTKLMKEASSFIGKKELESNGSNIAIVLKDILSDEEKSRKFHNLLEFALPHIKGIQVTRATDRSLVTTLSEVYNENFSLPSVFFSDGTIDIIALIVALYFEEKNIVIIEEPEKNVHPSLISKIVEMCKDASQHKQVIVTTHSPEFVKHAGKENLILIKRDEEGFSVAERIEDKEELKAFFKNEIGVEELFIENFFES